MLPGGPVDIVLALRRKLLLQREADPELLEGNWTDRTPFRATTYAAAMIYANSSI
jgi:hypothetical protein